jgi:SET domain-containing protein
MYPSVVTPLFYGYGLFASDPISTGQVVEKFTGPIVSYDQLQDEEIRYALLLQNDEWLVCSGNARYINHSCDPNCIINDELEVVAASPIAAGEELTFSYNMLSIEEWERNPDYYFWDPRWTFVCHCGAPVCQGVIDKYVIINGGQSANKEALL